MPAKESHIRSILKGVTWRVVGTLDTLVISWFVIEDNHNGGALAQAGSIALWDTVVKFVLYYLHERAWQNIPIGAVRRYKLFKRWAKRFVPRDYRSTVAKKESHIRSLLKGISWRVVGTLTTVVVAYILTGDTSSALAIGTIEVFTKLLLYYLHERAWQLAPRGTVREVIPSPLDSSTDLTEEEPTDTAKS